jgi:hypothetical protein
MAIVSCGATFNLKITATGIAILPIQMSCIPLYADSRTPSANWYVKNDMVRFGIPLTWSDCDYQDEVPGYRHWLCDSYTTASVKLMPLRRS